MQPIMRSPLSGTLEFRRRGGGSFDIASTNPSAYYDRTNLATLFQDSEGTTPVTADSQPIGLGLDQSQGVYDGSNGAKRVNACSYSADIGDSAWLTYGAITKASNAALAPDGSMTACRLTAAATTSEKAVQNMLAYSCSKLSFYAKSNGMQWIGFRQFVYTYQNVCFDIVNGVLGTVGPGFTGASIIDVGGGWYHCSATATSDAISQLQLALFGADNTQSFLGDGVSGAYVWGADCRKLIDASELPAYQKTTATWASTIQGAHQIQAIASARPATAGIPIYADFDAVDDALVATFPTSLGAGCTVCRSLPGTGASITTGVTLTATYTDNVDAHALLIYTAAQWAALDAGQIANITALLNAKAGV